MASSLRDIPPTASPQLMTTKSALIRYELAR
jgi:hypothetical protein